MLTLGILIVDLSPKFANMGNQQIRTRKERISKGDLVEGGVLEG